MSFNVIITHEQGLDNYRFIMSRLRRIGFDYVVVDKGPSIILLRVEDPYRAIEQLKESIREVPVVYRVIPVDLVVDPYVEVIAEKAEASCRAKNTC